MEEEVRMTEYHGGSSGADENRVAEWELGLPSSDDLTPLSQRLIPPELASAFSISPEPHRTSADVARASRDTLSTIRSATATAADPPIFRSFVENDDGSDPRKEEDSNNNKNSNLNDDVLSKGSKRPRLVWTPQLHKRFVDVVAHLGIKNAVPKTIMQLMNVEGLTRENVASHLQKYRLYLKRMQGLSHEGPSSSDPLFSSTLVPHNLNNNNANNNNNNNNEPQVQMPMQMHYPQMVYQQQGGYHGFESHPWMQRNYAAGSHDT